MMGSTLFYISAFLVAFWGIAHIFPTKGVVKNFGDISRDNRRIITMEWVGEGIFLVYIGVLVALVTAVAGPKERIASLVYWSAAAFLAVMAVWHSFTGAKTRLLPMKLCPVIFSTAAILIILGILY